jgi:hypothetical protein
VFLMYYLSMSHIQSNKLKSTVLFWISFRFFSSKEYSFDNYKIHR